MNKLILNEWIKLKHTKWVWLSLLMVVLTPISVALLVLMMNKDIQYNIVSEYEYVALIIKVIVRFLSMTLMTFFASELIEGEFSMDTFRFQLTIPISKNTFLFSKILALCLWVMLNMILMAIVTYLLLLSVFKMERSTLDLMTLYVVFIKTGLLVLPFSFFTIAMVLFMKNTFVPLMVNIGILTSTLFISKYSWEHLVPWSAPNQILFGRMAKSNLLEAYISLGLLALISLLFIQVYLKRIEL